MSKWALIPDGTTPPDVVVRAPDSKTWGNVWFIFASDDSSSDRLHQIGMVYQERVWAYGWQLHDVPECPTDLRGRTMSVVHEHLAGAVMEVQTLLMSAGVDVKRRRLV